MVVVYTPYVVLHVLYGLNNLHLVLIVLYKNGTLIFDLIVA